MVETRSPRRNTSSSARSSPRGATDTAYEEKVVQIRRCTKVTKGRKRLSFSALVVVGNQAGSVGYGYAKALEVPFAVEKAVKRAQKNMLQVSLKGTTLPHTVFSKYGASRVLLRPACSGTGVVASSAVRAVLESLGVRDALSKVLGSRNPLTVLRACFQGLEQVQTKEAIQTLRGVRVGW